MSITAHPDGINVFDEGYARCPHAVLDPAREAGAVLPTVREAHYVALAYEEARAILLDTENFSATVSRHEPTPPHLVDPIAAIRAEGPETVPAMLQSDAPVHGRYRRLVSRAFTPRMLASFEPTVREFAEELLAAVPEGEPFDFVTAFAEPFPVMVICRMLGLPDSAREDIRRWTLASVGNIGQTPADDEGWLANERVLLDLHQKMHDILENPTEFSREGILGTLTEAIRSSEGQGEEDPLTLKHLLTVVRELVVAGNETSGKVLAESIVRFGGDREIWARIRKDPSYADLLTEEALRIASPTQAAVRRVVKDVTVGGQDLPAESTVVISLAGANGDPGYWKDPAELCPERDKVKNHLAFGAGPHTCVGAGLTRLEMQVAFRVIAEHFDAIDVVDADQVRWTTGWMLRGPEEIPARAHRHEKEA